MTTVLHTKKGSDDVRRLQEQLAWIMSSFGVKRIGIFGSVARGEETDASDIDILVEFAQEHATFRNFMIVSSTWKISSAGKWIW